MKAFSAAACREITSAKAFIGGAWRTLTVGKVYKGGAWQSAASFVLPMSVAITPNPAFGRGTGYVTSNTITATPTGGLAPFTYSWTVVSSAPRLVTINSPATASTTATADVSGGDVNFTLQCVATDSLGTAVTAQGDGLLSLRDPYGRYF